jgi:hypothetical protein
MQRNRKENKSNQQQASEPDFNTPTYARLRRKMVNWKDVVFQLMDEFPKARVGIVSPHMRFKLLNFCAASVIASPRYERAVYRRAKQLERRAWFCNADIKFGFRASKRGWQQAAV